MAITNLTNTSWYFNETLDHYGIGEPDQWHIGELIGEWYIDINWYDVHFNQLYFELGSSNNVWFDTVYEDGSIVEEQRFCTAQYETGSWRYEAFRTITITGGPDVEDPDLITWITSNAVQVEDPHPTHDTNKHCLVFSSPTNFTLEAIEEGYDHMGRDPEMGGVEPWTTNRGYWDGIMLYSTDGFHWSEWGDQSTYEASYGLPSVDGKLYLRGIGNKYISTIEVMSDDVPFASCSYYFKITGDQVSCAGNIETLLDCGVVANGGHPETSDCGFAYLFVDCTALVSAPDILMETIPSDYCRAMFAGCTNLVKAPRITATHIDYCACMGMFSGCTNLTQLPELLATTVDIHAYGSMFYGCPSIKLSTEKTDEYKYEYRIPSSGTCVIRGAEEYGYTSADVTQDMFAETGGTFTGSPEINTTYYTSNEIVRAFPPEEVKPSATFDLSTLNLPVGTYAIYVKLSAPGYRDSEPSNEAVYSTEVTLDPEWHHYGVIPEGWCLEYTDAEGEFYSLGEGDPFPVDKSIYANHASYYSSDEQYICEENEWRYEEILAADDGGSVVSVLASIDGLPVTSANLSSGNIGMYAIAAIIPVSVTTIVSVAPFWGNGRLTSITYLGTMEQWNQITLEPNWNKGCSEITVTCTDGTIIIPAYNS